MITGLLVGLHKNYFMDFSKSWWTWRMEHRNRGADLGIFSTTNIAILCHSTVLLMFS